MEGLCLNWLSRLLAKTQLCKDKGRQESPKVKPLWKKAQRSLTNVWSGKVFVGFLKNFYLVTNRLYLVICLCLCCSEHTGFLSIYWVYQACRPSRSFVLDFPFPELFFPRVFTCFPFLLLQDLYLSISCLRLTQPKTTKAIHTLRLLPFFCLFSLTQELQGSYNICTCNTHLLCVYQFPLFSLPLTWPFLEGGDWSS